MKIGQIEECYRCAIYTEKLSDRLPCKSMHIISAKIAENYDLVRELGKSVWISLCFLMSLAVSKDRFVRNKERKSLRIKKTVYKNFNTEVD